MKKSIIFAIVVLIALGGCTPYMKANMAFKQKDYKEAQGFYQEYLKENPEDDMVRKRLAFCQLMAGESGAAITNYQKVAAKYDDVPIYVGMALLQQGDLEKAAAQWAGYNQAFKPLVKSALYRAQAVLEITKAKAVAQTALAGDAKSLDHDFVFVALPGKGENADALSQAMSSVVISDISSFNTVKTLDFLDTQAIVNKIVDQAPDQAAKECMNIMSGTGKSCVGSVGLSEDDLESSWTVADAADKDKLHSFNLVGQAGQFYEMEKEIVYNLISVMGIMPNEKQEESFNKYPTTDLRAFTDYGQGLVLLGKDEYDAAREAFARAAQKDSGFALAKYWKDHCPDSGLVSKLDMNAAAGELASGTPGPKLESMAETVNQYVLDAVIAQEKADKDKELKDRNADNESDTGCGC